MMKDLKLILEHLRYFKARSLLMFVAISLAFLTYGVLGSLRYSLNSGEASVSEQRLITTHEMGLMQTLPLAYLERIRKIEGVGRVGYATWMGSFFQEQRNMLMAFAVDGPVWLAQHPDMAVSEEARSRFLEDRRGMLISRPLALKYGWKVGDAVPLKSILFAPLSGDLSWTYIVSGVFTSNDAGGGRNYIITHYDYMNKDRRLWPNTVGTFMVTPAKGTTVTELARRIDAEFVDSAAPTSTMTDKAFHAEFFAQFGNVVDMITLVILVTFSSVMIIVTSGMALSIRQRTRDIGILRAIGYSDIKIYWLVIGQTGTIVVMGACLGLASTAFFNRWITLKLPQFLPDIVLPRPLVTEALLIIAAVTIITAIVPVLIAVRVRPIEAFTMSTGQEGMV